MNSAEQLSSPLEESAFAALVERHHGELQLDCYRILGSIQDAKDLVQQTFLRTWRDRASFRATAAAEAGPLGGPRRPARPAGATRRLRPAAGDRQRMLDAIDAGLLRPALVVARRR
jgi:hypothetical protein